MIIKIKKMGKLFEIKTEYAENVITRYARRSDLFSKIKEVCHVL